MREIDIRKIREFKCDKCGGRNKRIIGEVYSEDDIVWDITCCHCGNKIKMEKNIKHVGFPKRIDECAMIRACNMRECVLHPDHAQFIADSVNKTRGANIYTASDFSCSPQLRIKEENKRFL